MSERVGLETLCECGHRFDLHAIGEKDECVRYIRGVRCECREFVAAEDGVDREATSEPDA